MLRAVSVPLPLKITDDLLFGFLHFAVGLCYAGRNRTPGVFDRGMINIKFRRILEGCFRRLVLGLPAIRHGIRLFAAWFAIGDIHLHSIAFPVLKGDPMLSRASIGGDRGVKPQFIALLSTSVKPSTNAQKSDIYPVPGLLAG